MDIDVAAGEYGYSPDYFATMVTAGAVDCLQADATRCGGYTAWLRAAPVAEAPTSRSRPTAPPTCTPGWPPPPSTSAMSSTSTTTPDWRSFYSTGPLPRKGLDDVGTQARATGWSYGCRMPSSSGLRNCRPVFLGDFCPLWPLRGVSISMVSLSQAQRQLSNSCW